MIISLVNIKGGCGKSTLSTNLAAVFAGRGFKVGLVDTDTQGTSFNWVSTRSKVESDIPLITFACLPTPELLKQQIPGLKKSCNVIVIDGTPGKDAFSINSAVITVSDIVIVPITPSMSDLWATVLTVQKIKEVSVFANFRSFALINAQVKNSHLLQETISVLSEEDAFSVIPLLDSRISSYVAFGEAIGTGMGVIEMKNRNKQAVLEIEALADEITERNRKG